MPFAKEDKILIRDNNDKDLVREFPSKGWNVGLVYELLQKLQIAGSVGSGRRRSTCTTDNIDLVYKLVSHESAKRKIIFAQCT